MKPRYIFSVMVLAALFATALPAASATDTVSATDTASAVSLTLGQAQELAVQSSNSVKSSQLDLLSAERTSKINADLPTISLSAGLNASAGLIRESQISLGANIGAGISYRFLSESTYTDQTRLLNVDSSRLSLEAEESNVRIQAITLYWNVVAQDLNIQSLQSALDSAVTSHQANIEKYDAGQIDSLTLSQSELSLYTAEQNLSEARISAESAKAELQKLIGMADLSSMDGLLTVSAVKDISCFTSDIYKSISVKQSLVSQEKAVVAYDSAKYSATTPTLNASASVGLSTTYSTSTGTLTLGDSYSGSLSLSIPTDSWFSDSATSVNLENLDTAIEQARLKTQQARQDALNAIQDIYDSINRCIRSQSVLEKKLTLLESQLKLTQDSYAGGRTDYLSLLEAQENVFQGRLSILQNQLDYTVYVCTLAEKLGVGVSELLNK